MFFFIFIFIFLASGHVGDAESRVSLCNSGRTAATGIPEAALTHDEFGIAAPRAKHYISLSWLDIYHNLVFIVRYSLL